ERCNDTRERDTSVGGSYVSEGGAMCLAITESATAEDGLAATTRSRAGPCRKLPKIRTSADLRDVRYQLLERQVTLAQVGRVRGAGRPEQAFLVYSGSLSDCRRHPVDVLELVL